jgi:hypothetical protein
MSTTQSMLFHLGGVPVVGDLPLFYRKTTLGVKYYFVDGVGGNDANEGGADAPVESIEQAITLANARINWSGSPWANSDVIVVAPGVYAENLTSLPYGCTIVGLGDAYDADGQNGVTIKPASGSPVDVGAAINMKIINVRFESADTSRVFDAAVCNNVQLIHCVFAGAPEATTSTAGIYVNDSVMLTVRDCRFMYLDCGIDAVYADGGDSFTRALIDRNFFTYISEAGIRVSASLVAPGSMICDNRIGQGGQTLAIGIDINMATNTTDIFGNIISATDGIEGDTTGVYVGGNYCNGVLE